MVTGSGDAVGRWERRRTKHSGCVESGGIGVHVGNLYLTSNLPINHDMSESHDSDCRESGWRLSAEIMLNLSYQGRSAFQLLRDKTTRSTH